MDPVDDIADGEREALTLLYDGVAAAAASPTAREQAASWQGVRDVVQYARASGFDEEPSGRVDALLMAAARAHAPERPSAVERLRRWLAATMLQPAVAGATALAVIGGTAGILYMRGQGGVAEPTASRVAAPPMTPGSPPDRPLEARSSVDLATLGSGSGAVAGGEPSDVAERFGTLEQEESTRPMPAAPRPEGGGSADADKLEGLGGDAYRVSGREVTTVVTTDDRDGDLDDDRGGVTGAVTGGVVTKMPIGDPPPPPPPPDTETDRGGGGGDGNGTQLQVTGTTDPVAVKITAVRGDKQAPRKRSQAENLLRQARTAARKKDCGTVKVMARRAKQLDAGYYASTFIRDPEVANCL